MDYEAIHVAIDLGNTTAKVGIFSKGNLLDSQVDIAFASLSKYVNELNPNHVIVSSVNQKVDELESEIQCPVLNLNYKTPIPISNKYTTPETLGRDRLAGAVGAYAIESHVNTLIIDVGTCITYDFINNNNEYLGGGISPGIELKYKALHNFTAHLPLIEGHEANNLIGDSTESAIVSGVINGTIAEIDEIIRMYKDKFSHLRIIMCGGGAIGLHHKLITETKLLPDLVLIGLNRILEYNV